MISKQISNDYPTMTRRVSSGPAVQYPKGTLNYWLAHDDGEVEHIQHGCMDVVVKKCQISNIHWQLKAFLQNDFSLLCDLLMLCRDEKHKVQKCNARKMYEARLTDNQGRLKIGVKDVIFACLCFDIHFPGEGKSHCYTIYETKR